MNKMLGMLSRRRLLQTLGVAAVCAPLSLLAQGRCMLTFGTPACNTTDVAPIFAPTGWKTVALDHITFRAADYRKEGRSTSRSWDGRSGATTGRGRCWTWATGDPRSSR